MPAGRPTKYTPEIVQEAWDYIENYADHKHMIPSVIGMSKVINIASSTLYDWSNQDNNEFSEILREVNDSQQFALLNGGLSGEFNSNITKLALGKHGFSDRQDINADIVAKELTRAQLEAKLLAQGIDPEAL